MKKKLDNLRSRLKTLKEKKQSPLIPAETMLQSAADYMEMSVSPHLQAELDSLIQQTLNSAEYFIKYLEEKSP